MSDVWDMAFDTGEPGVQYLVDDPRATSSLAPMLLLSADEYARFKATGEIPEGL